MSKEQFFNTEMASKYLSITRKHLENYSKIGDEISSTRVGIRKLFSKKELDSWLAIRDYGFTKLDQADYIKCLEFAIKSFYLYSSTSDFGTSEQRDAGKFISNFVSGKLGEIAFSKFLKKNFDIDSRLDFDQREAVVGQDIVEIAKPRRGKRVYNPPKQRLAIKSTKMKNVWLIVPAKEVEDKDRLSDVYILTRVDLYLNHFLRIMREYKALRTLSDIIPKFESIDAQVCGYISRDNLIVHEPVNTLPSPNQRIQLSYIVRTGDLKKTDREWSKLIERL